MTQQTVACGRGYNSHVQKWVLTPEQEEWLRKWFPLVENSRLLKASGMSHSTLHRFAVALGLKKDADALHAIMVRTGRKNARMLEKNGYYASLRGKPGHPESIAGTKRRWQLIREGKLPHPLEVAKQKSPRKYKRAMKEKGERRRALIEAEKRRVKWGLPRKTKLHIVAVKPYTHNQSCRRHNATRRGYILADDCTEGSGNRWVIFFDADTKRSAVFERNGIKDGFRFEPWINN